MVDITVLEVPVELSEVSDVSLMLETVVVEVHEADVCVALESEVDDVALALVRVSVDVHEVEVGVSLEREVDDVALVLDDVMVEVPVVDAGVVVDEPVTLDSELVDVVEVGISVEFGNEKGATHQHSRYIPPIAVVVTLSHVTLAPLAKTEMNKPEFANRGKKASWAHVSITENLSSLLR
jgi:hypothetical protein